MRLSIEYSLFVILLCLCSLSYADIKVYFSPNGGCQAAIISEINKAKKTIDIADYELTSREIVQELVIVKERNVKIRIVLDKAQEKLAYSKGRYLLKRGFEVRYDTGSGLMHNKFAIIDDNILITGSFNWTASAEERNEENLLILTDQEVIKAYKKRFEYLFGKARQGKVDSLSIESASKADQTNFSNKEEEWTNKDWSVASKVGRIFYITHGSAVWGHEFGFFKNSGSCGGDILWISFSSDNDKVLDFVGKIVQFRINVDGQSYDVNLNMLDANKLTPVTKVMLFTNFVAGDKFIDLLNKGHKVSIKIIGPKEFVKFLDIPEDSFSLDGYIASRLKAKDICLGIK